ncbi:transposon Ty3-I Gag-Pol polyprotein [Trichonephila clavipes]|nr:transposon Ty3-I Gag-Pol polyprotein [Trichonephila clavipes]
MVAEIENCRRSHSLQGLSPEFGLLVSPTRGKAQEDMSQDSGCQTFPIFHLVQLVRAPSIFHGEADEKESFEKLKTAFTSEPVLGLFDEKAPTELHADASGCSLGTLLVQIQKGKEKVIAYASRTLTKAERNYLTTECECLRKDPELSKLIHTHEKAEPVMKTFSLIDIILSKNFGPNGRKWLPIIPKHLRLEILQHFHDASTAGHLGFTKMYDRIRKRFFWPGLYRSVRRYVMHCRECQRRKLVPQKPPGLLIPIPPALVPFQHVGVDLLGRFPRSTKGNKWCIACTDYFSRFAVTKALPTAKAEEVAKFITEESVLEHGAPRTTLTDCGKVFESKLVTELC